MNEKRWNKEEILFTMNRTFRMRGLSMPINLNNHLWLSYVDYLWDHIEEGESIPIAIKFENEIAEAIKIYPERLKYFTEISKNPESIMKKKELIKEFLLICAKYSEDKPEKTFKKYKEDINKNVSFDYLIDFLWFNYVGCYNRKHNLPTPIFHKDGTYENVFFKND